MWKPELRTGFLNAEPCPALRALSEAPAVNFFPRETPTFQINGSSITPPPLSAQAVKMDSQSVQNGPGQVQVLFTTNFPDIELPEGKRQLLVPTGK
jgi:hypothetical protein